MAKSTTTSKTVGISTKLQREIALGMHRIKPVKTLDNWDCIRRWLDDKEEVEFTSADIGNYNGEFQINGEDSHKMWFSQFSGIYLNPNDLMAHAISTITFKGSGEKYVRQMNPYSFWKAVQGKRFRVSVDCDYPVVIDSRNEKVKELKTVSKVLKYISDNLDCENYNAVKGMTKTSRLYSLIEI